MRSALLALSLILVTPLLGAAAPQEEWFDVDSSRPPLIVDNSSARTPESATPMAPLPPAVIVGPIGIAMAGWAHWRMRRRGGI